jgi:16S rRNA (guanine527-N7)-methyltransferase
MTPTELLESEAQKLGLTLDKEQLARFDDYTTVLLETNKIMNLTRITDPLEIAVKHYADSLTLLQLPCFTGGASVIDVGTGAGFPGIPLKIARPDLSVTLLDSMRKRIDFLEKACLFAKIPMLRASKDEPIAPPGQHNPAVTLVWARAEDAARDKNYREAYDIAVSRAVASLPVLMEYCLPFVRPGGMFIAMKGPDPAAEIDASRNALSVLGGDIEEIRTVTLSGNITHTLISVKKISQTSTKYPRNSIKIARSPL